MNTPLPLQTQNPPPTIVLLLCPETSSFNASFTLARGLQARGYRMLYTGPAQWADYILRQGFDYRIVEPEPWPDAEAAYAAARSRFERWRLARREMRYYRKLVERLIEQSVEQLRAENAVMLLIDPLLGPHSLAPLLSGIPAVALNTTLASTFDSRIPPVFSGLIASARPGWIERARNRSAWSKWLWRAWWRRFLFDKLVPLWLGLPPGLSDVARVERLGGRVRWGEYGPCLAVPECVLAIPELDFPLSTIASKRVYAGSSVDLRRSDGEFDWGAIDPHARLVYCSLGTYSAGFDGVKRVFAALIEALRQREDLQAIVQIGSAATAADFGELPARIRLVDRVPQLKMLEHADIFITHGGFSSYREAAYFGVPMIVLPVVNDGLGNAARIVHHQMGLRADYAKVDTAQVLDLLARIDDPRYVEAAARMKAAMRAQLDCRDGIAFIVAELALRGGVGSSADPAMQRVDRPAARMAMAE